MGERRSGPAGREAAVEERWASARGVAQGGASPRSRFFFELPEALLLRRRLGRNRRFVRQGRKLFRRGLAVGEPALDFRSFVISRNQQEQQDDESPGDPVQQGGILLVARARARGRLGGFDLEGGRVLAFESKSSRTGGGRRSDMDRGRRSAQLLESSWYSASVVTFQQSYWPPWILRTASMAVIIEWS